MDSIPPKQAQIGTEKQPAVTTRTSPEQSNVGQKQGQGATKSSPSKIRTAKRKERMLQAIKNNGGHIVRAAELAGIDRSTHIRWQQKDPAYAAKVQELMLPRLYNAQLVIDTATMDYKNKPELAVKTAMFTLEHLGGELGYTKPGTNIQVNNQINNREQGAIWEIKQMLKEAAEEEEREEKEKGAGAEGFGGVEASKNHCDGKDLPKTFSEPANQAPISVTPRKTEKKNP